MKKVKYRGYEAQEGVMPMGGMSKEGGEVKGEEKVGGTSESRVLEKIAEGIGEESELYKYAQSAFMGAPVLQSDPLFKEFSSVGADILGSFSSIGKGREGMTEMEIASQPMFYDPADNVSAAYMQEFEGLSKFGNYANPEGRAKIESMIKKEIDLDPTGPNAQMYYKKYPNLIARMYGDNYVSEQMGKAGEKEEAQASQRSEAQLKVEVRQFNNMSDKDKKKFIEEKGYDPNEKMAGMEGEMRYGGVLKEMKMPEQKMMDGGMMKKKYPGGGVLSMGSERRNM